MRMIGLKLHTLCQDLRGDNLLKQHVNESPPSSLSHTLQMMSCACGWKAMALGERYDLPGWTPSTFSLSSSCHWRVQKEVLLISPLHTGKFQPVTKPLSMFEAIKVRFSLRGVITNGHYISFLLTKHGHQKQADWVFMHSRGDDDKDINVRIYIYIYIHGLIKGPLTTLSKLWS